jgi:hypothetical protein
MAKRKRSTLERRQQGQKLNRRERQEIERRFQREDPGWDIVHKNGAGLDVGNASHFVAIDPKLDSRPVREFGSWTAALREMADWLKGLGIQRVVPIWGPAIVPYGDDSDVGSRRGRRWHVIWPVLSTACSPRGEAWVDRGAAYFEQKRQEREVHHLQRRAAAIGMQLVAAN